MKAWSDGDAAKCSYLFAVRHETGSERNEWKHLSAAAAAAVANALLCVCVCVSVIASLNLSLTTKKQQRPHGSRSLLDQRNRVKGSGRDLSSSAAESL